MRTVIITGLFLGIVLSLQSQPDSTLLAKLESAGLKTDSKSIDRYTGVRLWGLVGFSDRFVADETEITVAEWLEFICYHDFENFPSYTTSRSMQVKTALSEELSFLQAAKYDSTLFPIPQVLNGSPIEFISKPCINRVFVREDGLHGKFLLLVPADTILDKEKRKRFENYLHTPITGISYDQAIAFCKWRTAVDSVILKKQLDLYSTSIREKDKLIEEWRYLRNFRYTLPTAAQFDIMNPGVDSLSKNNQANFNYRNAFRKNADLYGSDPVNVFKFEEPYYLRRNYKVTHIQGNVAEMTAERGIAKGGSYYHPAAESYPGTEIKYTNPTPWLGFRCVGIKYSIDAN